MKISLVHENFNVFWGDLNLQCWIIWSNYENLCSQFDFKIVHALFHLFHLWNMQGFNFKESEFTWKSVWIWSSGLSLVTTRLVNTSPGDQQNRFIIRTGMKDGVQTHEFRCETHRDLAQWARSLVKGSHAEALAMIEYSCSEFRSDMIESLGKIISWA